MLQVKTRVNVYYLRAPGDSKVSLATMPRSEGEVIAQLTRVNYVNLHQSKRIGACCES